MDVRAACHVHSDWSYDGRWSIESLAAKFARGGCRILMTTEHDRGFTSARLDQYRVACARASSDRILILPGMEYSDASNQVHILVWGQVPFLGEGIPTTELLCAVQAANGVAVLAHPTRKSAWRVFQTSWADRLLGIELWNRKYDGWAPSRTAPPLLNMTGAISFVGLDFHTQRQSFPLRMRLQLDGKITQASVLGCLRSRSCHPEALGLSLEGNTFRRAVPSLTAVERGRKAAASLVRRTRGFAS